MKHFLGYVATAAVAGEVVNVAGVSGIAVGGYDPVAFFTDGKPTPGDPDVTSTYKGATYLFASKAHKTQFEANPEEYVPQFGGFCAFGAALGALFPVDINTWQVRNGKLYLNLNPAISAEFNKDPGGGVIAKAEKNWPGLVKKYGNCTHRKTNERACAKPFQPSVLTVRLPPPALSWRQPSPWNVSYLPASVSGELWGRPSSGQVCFCWHGQPGSGNCLEQTESTMEVQRRLAKPGSSQGELP